MRSSLYVVVRILHIAVVVTNAVCLGIIVGKLINRDIEFYIAIAIISGICLTVSSATSPPKVQQKNLSSWRIVEIQKEKHWFSTDDNTLLENVESKERKTVKGKLGNKDEIIYLK